ncbi:MAG: hypothetical protein GFGODING_02304 [Flavobacteriales bacterium]|nr:hypothetical protein [Flavobacteriales bacterium]
MGLLVALGDQDARVALAIGARVIAEGDGVAFHQDVRRAVVGPQLHAVPMGGHRVVEDVHIAVAAALHAVARAHVQHVVVRTVDVHVLGIDAPAATVEAGRADHAVALLPQEVEALVAPGVDARAVAREGVGAIGLDVQHAAGAHLHIALVGHDAVAQGVEDVLAAGEVQGGAVYLEGRESPVAHGRGLPGVGHRHGARAVEGAVAHPAGHVVVRQAHIGDAHAHTVVVELGAVDPHGGAVQGGHGTFRIVQERSPDAHGGTVLRRDALPHHAVAGGEGAVLDVEGPAVLHDDLRAGFKAHFGVLEEHIHIHEEPTLDVHGTDEDIAHQAREGTIGNDGQRIAVGIAAARLHEHVVGGIAKIPMRHGVLQVEERLARREHGHGDGIDGIARAIRCAVTECDLVLVAGEATAHVVGNGEGRQAIHKCVLAGKDLGERVAIGSPRIDEGAIGHENEPVFRTVASDAGSARRAARVTRGAIGESRIGSFPAVKAHDGPAVGVEAAVIEGHPRALGKVLGEAEHVRASHAIGRIVKPALRP